jgi:transposase
VFYKERWIRENDLEQRLIVTFSLKYQNYQRLIRRQQIERAQSLIEKTPARIDRTSQTDAKRFIKKTAVTKDGEIADKDIYALDEEAIAQEEAFDGFYGVCTNLEDDVEAIIKVNKRRWEIEECFRIIKHEFKARPVYLSRDKRIEAHFTTCFIALMIYRLLEKKLGNKYTSTEIIEGLRSLDFYKVKGEGYLPTYTRTDFTDDLHETFGFRTDYQIVTNKQMKEIFRQTKK